MQYGFTLPPGDVIISFVHRPKHAHAFRRAWSVMAIWVGNKGPESYEFADTVEVPTLAHAQQCCALYMHLFCANGKLKIIK